MAERNHAEGKIDEVILIDLKNVAYRLHFGNMNLSTTDGRPTSVLHGVMVTVLKLHKKFPDAAMVFCNDSEKNWRKAHFADTYKANRTVTEDSRKVNVQVPILKDILIKLGFKVVEVEGFEADDLIGILASEMSQHYYGYGRALKSVQIVSNDKDFFQLVSGRIQILRPMPNGKVQRIRTGMDVYRNYFVYPNDWVNYRALSGDTSDNIKHISGIGPKTAVKMLEAGVNPSFEDFGRHPKEVRTRFAQLRDNWTLVHQSYLLSKIPTRVKWKNYPKGLYLGELVVELGTILKNPCREFPKSIDEMSDEYLNFLCDYELMYLLGRRHEVWRIK